MGQQGQRDLGKRYSDGKARQAPGKARTKPPAQDAKPEKAKAAPAALSALEVHEIFAKLAAAMPDPKTELEHVNPYTLLVAVVLSAQATDAGVNKATRSLFAKVDTPQKMVALGEEGLREAIKTIGLFNTKAKNVIALSKALVENHGGTGAARPRRARSAAGRRAQIGECRAQRRLRPAHHRGGHAYLPGREPHWPCFAARRRWRWSWASNASCRRTISSMLTIGSSFTAAMSARRRSPNAGAAS